MDVTNVGQDGVGMDSRLLTSEMTTGEGGFTDPTWFRLGHRSFAVHQDDKLKNSCQGSQE
jgi:hypothetical protein